MSFRRIIISLFLTAAAVSVATSVGSAQQRIHNIAVEGVISPVTADYIDYELRRAAEEGAEVLVIRLDTPGGLMQAMRAIIKIELGAQIPVVMYVAPSGAQCAS
ncbi:MAG TPA: nodulation protein NfeD, partial [bacterium]|nr:nodulation protein NfeD [bacterium]